MLRARYLQSMPAKHAALEAAWREVLRVPSEPSLRELHDLVHRLLGSAPTYGCEAIGRCARAVDASLREDEDDRDDSLAEGARIAERIAIPMQALLDSLAQAAQDTTEP